MIKLFTMSWTSDQVKNSIQFQFDDNAVKRSIETETTFLKNSEIEYHSHRQSCTADWQQEEGREANACVSTAEEGKLTAIAEAHIRVDKDTYFDTFLYHVGNALLLEGIISTSTPEYKIYELQFDLGPDSMHDSAIWRDSAHLKDIELALIKKCVAGGFIQDIGLIREALRFLDGFVCTNSFQDEYNQVASNYPLMTPVSHSPIYSELDVAGWHGL
jgi:hypothetical protein